MSTRAPTPLAASLLALIERPLSLHVASNLSSYDNIVKCFCASFMSVGYSEQVYNFILPSVKHSQRIPVSELIRCLLDKDQSIDRSFTLLHSLMRTVDGQVG